MTVLRLAKEFGFRVVLHHVSDGWKVADEIAAAKVPCSVIVIDSPGRQARGPRLALRDRRHAGKGRRARRRFTPTIGSPTRACSAAARRWPCAPACRGPGRCEALTLAGAQMLDLQDRIGSLEPGKDADFVILEGDPLSVYAKTLETWVEGVKVFDRNDPSDQLYAVGGYGAGHDQSPYLCCFDNVDVGRCEMTRLRDRDILIRSRRRAAARLGRRRRKSPCGARRSTPWPARRSRTASSSSRTARSRPSAGADQIAVPAGLPRARSRRRHARPGRRPQHGRLLGHLSTSRTIRTSSSGPRRSSPSCGRSTPTTPSEDLVEWVRGFGVTTIHAGHAPGELMSGPDDDRQDGRAHDGRRR